MHETTCMSSQSNYAEREKAETKECISSVPFSHSVVSDSLRPHESQHARPTLSITNSRSSLRLTSIESVMPSSHLILGRPLLLLPLIPPSIKVFSNESTLTIILLRWMVHMNGGVCQNLGGEKEQSHFACPQHNFFFWLHTWHVGS